MTSDEEILKKLGELEKKLEERRPSSAPILASVLNLLIGVVYAILKLMERADPRHVSPSKP